jgi:hypothetical protein
MSIKVLSRRITCDRRNKTTMWYNFSKKHMCKVHNLGFKWTGISLLTWLWSRWKQASWIIQQAPLFFNQIFVLLVIYMNSGQREESRMFIIQIWDFSRILMISERCTIWLQRLWCVPCGVPIRIEVDIYWPACKVNKGLVPDQVNCGKLLQMFGGK